MMVTVAAFVLMFIFIIMMVTVAALVLMSVFVVMMVTVAAAVFMLIMIVVTAVTVQMDMSVLTLFIGRLSDVQHFKIKIQIASGHWMVGIHFNLIAVNFLDHYRMNTFFSLRNKCGTDFRCYTAEVCQRDLLNQIFVICAVTVFSLYHSAEAVTLFMILQRGFKTRNQIVGSLHIYQRIILI